MPGQGLGALVGFALYCALCAIGLDWAKPLLASWEYDTWQRLIFVVGLVLLGLLGRALATDPGRVE